MFEFCFIVSYVVCLSLLSMHELATIVITFVVNFKHPVLCTMVPVMTRQVMPIETKK